MFHVHWQQGSNISLWEQFKMPVLFNKNHLKNSAVNMEVNGAGLMFPPKSRSAPQLRPLMTLLRLDLLAKLHEHLCPVELRELAVQDNSKVLSSCWD